MDNETNLRAQLRATGNNALSPELEALWQRAVQSVAARLGIEPEHLRQDFPPVRKEFARLVREAEATGALATEGPPVAPQLADTRTLYNWAKLAFDKIGEACGIKPEFDGSLKREPVQRIAGLLETAGERLHWLLLNLQKQLEAAAAAKEPPATASDVQPPALVWWLNFGTHGHLTLRGDEADSGRKRGAQVHTYVLAGPAAATEIALHNLVDAVGPLNDSTRCHFCGGTAPLDGKGRHYTGPVEHAVGCPLAHARATLAPPEGDGKAPSLVDVLRELVEARADARASFSAPFEPGQWHERETRVRAATERENAAEEAARAFLRGEPARPAKARQS